MRLLDKMRSGSSGRTPVAKARSSYGIDEAAELLRSLPKDNLDLVFTVVKKTLESFNVNVSQIVGDAQKKLDRLEGQKSTFLSEIDAFEKEIAMRKSAIEVLDTQAEETTNIKEHLEELQAVSDLGEIPDYAKKKLPEEATSEADSTDSGEGSPTFFKRREPVRRARTKRVAPVA